MVNDDCRHATLELLQVLPWTHTAPSHSVFILYLRGSSADSGTKVKVALNLRRRKCHVMGILIR